MSILFLLILSLSFQGCQKELSFEQGSPDDNNPASLTGQWKFLNLTAAVEFTSSFDINGQPGREKVNYNTTTQNNTGLLTVTETTMQTTDLGYTISAEVKIETLLGGIPVMPPSYEQLEFEQPPSSANAAYQRIGTDSLYFPDGAVFEVPGTNGLPMPGASDPSGASYTIKNDTLTIVSDVNKLTVIQQDNDELEIKQHVNIKARFLRQ